MHKCIRSKDVSREIPWGGVFSMDDALILKITVQIYKVVLERGHGRSRCILGWSIHPCHD